MKRITSQILIFLVIFSLISIHFPFQTLADDLAVTTVRIDRQKTSASTGGQICATTPNSDNGSENNVQIIFPSGFSVNSTSSNWDVSTSNIPNDSIAWPGIGTATSVNGQIVTFPSSNLSQNTKYCFNFSSSNTLTTPSSTGNYEGNLRTRNNNTIIDNHAFGLFIVNNDQITVTATVAADPTDFEAELEITDPPTTTVAHHKELTFTLTYGSNLGHNSSITPQISWSLGTIYGSGTPTVDVLDYVIGSATNAYNGSEPIIDTINRTISWPINSFPASTTGQTVSFKLKTTDAYKGGLPVSFTVNGRVLGPGTQTADSVVSRNYQYNFVITPTPVPPTDGRTDGRTDGNVSNPLGSLSITDVEVRTISPNDASVFVSTNKPSDITLTYGTSINSLTNSIDSRNLTQHLLKIPNLEPNTKYYFRIIATSDENERIVSDFFVFISAILIEPISYNPSSLIVLSQNVILFDSSKAVFRPDKTPFITIPLDTAFNLKFSMDNTEQLKNVSIFSRDNNVLGINNITNISPDSNSNAILELALGEFVSSLKTQEETGEFRLIARIEDFGGNVFEQNIAVINVSPFLKIFESGTNTPIENAKVTFSLYNPRLRTYNLISPAVLAIKNPNYSEPDGHVPVVLPDGKYKAEILALGYEAKTVEFIIDEENKESYPLVKLKKEPFSLITAIKYYSTIFTDLIHTAEHTLNNLKNSTRFFDFSMLTALVIFTIILIFALLHRLSIPLILLPWFAYYALRRISGKHEHIIQGVVIDSKTREGIEGIKIYISLNNGKIVSHTHTNSSGEFFASSPDQNVKITLSDKNYKNFSGKYKSNQTQKRILFELTPRHKKHFLTLEGFKWYTHFILSSLFSGFIFATLFLEVVLIPKFGIYKILPFVLITILSLYLWAYINKEKKIAQSLN